jgi:hypothetical protein
MKCCEWHAAALAVVATNGGTDQNSNDETGVALEAAPDDPDVITLAEILPEFASLKKRVNGVNMFQTKGCKKGIFWRVFVYFRIMCSPG